MSSVAVFTAIVIAIAALAASVVEAALKHSQSEARRIDALGLVRIGLTGIFGVVVGQVFTPTGASWWLASLTAITLMVALIAATQLASKYLGHRRFGAALTRATRGLVNSTTLLFTPLSLPEQDQPEEFEQELIESVEDFTETIVREVMVPRIDMVTVPADAKLPEAMTILLARGHSRLPVVGKSVDDVLGVLFIKDVARIAHEDPVRFASETVSKAARSAMFVPESLSVEDLLQQMQANATHMAIVVDEYGGVAGLATIEDVIEELVGEISDEFDRDVPDVTPIEDGVYRINARYSLFELGELFGLELEDEEVDSVGGLVTKVFGRLPKLSDSITFSGLEFTVERIESRRKRLVTVLVRKLHGLQNAEAAFETENGESK